MNETISRNNEKLNPFSPLKGLSVILIALFPLGAEASGVPAFLDVPEQLDADLVRIEPLRG